MRARVAFVMAAVCMAASLASAQTTKPVVPRRPPAQRPAAPKPLTNADIVKMAKAFSEEFIVETIRGAAKPNFDLSTDGLVALKSAGISEAVIRVMRETIGAILSPTPRSPAPLPLPAARAVTIPLGTEVKLALSRTLSSQDARTGEPITFEVADDVAIDGVIAIKKGARASGVVTKAVSQLLTRGGSLEFSIDAVQAVGGQEIVLKATHIAAAGRGKIRGNELKIPVGSVFTATVAQAQQLTLAGGAPVRPTKSGTPIAPPSPAPRTGRFTIFVSAPQREGFFDTTKEIQDSIKDVRELLTKQKDVAFTITDNLAGADIVLTIVERGVGSFAYGQRTSFEYYYGGSQLQSTPMVANSYWVSSILQVGKYKKEFTGKWTQDGDTPFTFGAWGICANQIGRNVTSWVTTNAELINKMRS